MSELYKEDHAIDPEFEEALQKSFHKQENKQIFCSRTLGIHQRCPETNKVCYSRKEANWVVNHPLRGRKRVPVRTYLCKFCGSYHTTSKKPGFNKN